MKITKKAVLDNLSNLLTSLGGIAILMAVVFLIVAEIKANDTVVADANATAAVTEVQDAMSDIPSWLPIVVVAVIGGLLLGLVRFFRQ